MVKSQVFKFDEKQLQKDMFTFNDYGCNHKIEKFQCNINTANVWLAEYNMIYHHDDDVTNGVIGWYAGIPVTINNELDDGIVGIE